MNVVEFALLIMAIIFIAVMIICSVYKTTAIQDDTPSDASGSTQRRGAVWFTSALVATRADGTTVVESSRRHRKGLGPELSAASDTATPDSSQAWLRFWAPDRLTWWIAILFVAGSLLFVAGAAFTFFPGFFGLRTKAAASLAVGWSYLVGSISYSVAAYLSVLEHLNAEPIKGLYVTELPMDRFRWWGWEPHQIGFLASFIQLVGAFLFQIDTFYALMPGLGLTDLEWLVSGPSLSGSICFLVASYMGFMEVVHHFWGWQPHRLSWWLTLCNVLGSVGFVAGAIYGYVGTQVPHALSPFLSGVSFLLGSALFTVGSYLMLPELFSEPDPKT